MIGINNRNLEDFSLDISRTFELLADVPAGKTVVSESGIVYREQIDELERVGVDAVLVGETLMRADDPEAACRELTAQRRADAGLSGGSSHRARAALGRRSRSGDCPCSGWSDLHGRGRGLLARRSRARRLDVAHAAKAVAPLSGGGFLIADAAGNRIAGSPAWLRTVRHTITLGATVACAAVALAAPTAAPAKAAPCSSPGSKRS